MIKRLIAAFIIAVSLVATGACTRVDAGYTGIKINYSGTYRGAGDVPAVSGWVFYLPFAGTVLQYPTFVQTVEWKEGEAIQFNSKEGMVISTEMSLSYTLDPAGVPEFYVKFRNDDLTQFTRGFMRNTARDAFNAVAPLYTVDEIYGPKKEELLAKVQERIQSQVKVYGVKIDQFGVIGSMKLPENVVAALNNTIKATQDAIRVENELRAATAEAQKQVATAEGHARSTIALANGQAEANRIVNATITPNLIEWERLKIQQRWNGQLPEVVTSGSGGTFLSIPAGGR